MCADELPLPPMNELIPSSRVQANEFVNEFQTNELEKGVDELNQLEIIYSGDIFEEIDWTSKKARDVTPPLSTTLNLVAR